MRYRASSLLAGVFALAFFSFSAEAEALTRTITFPVDGQVSFRDDFGEPRDGGARTHMGNDIIAPKMRQEFAAVDGTITFIAIPEASWGYSITIRDADGYSYRYLHMNNDTPGTDDGQGGVANAYAPGITRGAHVTRGQLVGWVGDSGNAEDTVSHLHFEIHSPDGAAIDPYDSLRAAYSGVLIGNSAVVADNGSSGSLAEEAQFILRRSLQEGMVDPDVVTLHEELKTLGYYDYQGSASQMYSALTREAVRRFQNASKLPPTGIADAVTRKALDAAAKAAPVSVTPIPAAAVSGLSEGAQGEEVRALQVKLKALGFLAADATGYFGPLTRTALIAFQTAQGIDPVGFVGPKTRAALDAAESPTPTPAPGTAFVFTKDLEEGASGEEVRQLQLILKSEGHFNLEPTGYFGPLTRAALIAFQTANGIDPVGIVGPKTRAALNAPK